MAADSPRYDDLGQRVTTCCGCYSTYMDVGTFNAPEGQQALCCKACYDEVPMGEGDGSEFAPGVDPDAYYRASFAQDKLEPLTGFPHSLTEAQIAALKEDVAATFTEDSELSWVEYADRIDGRWSSYADVLIAQKERALRLLVESENLNRKEN